MLPMGKMTLFFLHFRLVSTQKHCPLSLSTNSIFVYSLWLALECVCMWLRAFALCAPAVTVNIHDTIGFLWVLLLAFLQLLRNRHVFFWLESESEKKETKGERRKISVTLAEGEEKNGRITCNPTLSIKRAINTAWVSLSVCSFRAATATATAITKQNNPRQWQQQNKKPKNTDDEFLFVTIFRNSHGLVVFLCGCVAPLTVTVVVYKALSFTSVSKSGTIASSWDVERNRTIERCEREAK